MLTFAISHGPRTGKISIFTRPSTRDYMYCIQRETKVPKTVICNDVHYEEKVSLTIVYQIKKNNRDGLLMLNDRTSG